MAWNPNYQTTTKATYLIAGGPKARGDIVYAEFDEWPDGDTTSIIYPDQTLPPDQWPVGTGRPEESACVLTFEKLHVGNYVIRVWVNDQEVESIEFERQAHTVQEDHEEVKRREYYVAGGLNITYPNTPPPVPGASFYVCGDGTYPLVQRTVQVGTNTYNGQIVRDGNSMTTPNWIVVFMGVMAGTGTVVITNANGGHDSKNIGIS